MLSLEMKSSLEKSWIKAVTFDLWETLFFETDGANFRRKASRCKNLVKALGNCGMAVSPTQVDLAMKETVSSLLRVWDTNKDVSHENQLRMFLHSVSKGPATIRDEWMARLSSAYVSPIFEVPSHIDARALALSW
jgi:hypothetical protein